MSNMLDYLTWRGDLRMTQSPLNAVDSLILAQLAYIPWESMLGETDRVPLRQLWHDRMDLSRLQEISFTSSDDRRLLEQTAQSERFGATVLCHCANERNENLEKQFAAITFLLDDGSAFVAFRGTDRSLVGWKEDLNMAFSRPIPSQVHACEYLTQVERAEGRPLYVGGHSKGGNLAMYAAACAEETVQAHVLQVFSHDGPGLSEKVFGSEGYSRIREKIRSFVPQSSLVGMLLMHPEDYQVVCSTSFSVLQHASYTWQVMGRDFVEADGLHRDSLYFKAVMKQWLANIDEEERRVFIDTLFDLLGAAESSSFNRELWINLLRNPKALLNVIRSVDAPTRQKVFEVLAALANAAVHDQARSALLPELLSRPDKSPDDQPH